MRVVPLTSRATSCSDAHASWHDQHSTADTRKEAPLNASFRSGNAATQAYSHCTPNERHALFAASCHIPKKLSAHRDELIRFGATLKPLSFSDEMLTEEDFVSEALASILGKRGPKQLARESDGRMRAYLTHLLRKNRITQADLLKLHSILAPDAPPGLRRHYANFDGWDAASAVYVAPPPSMLNAYLKDFIESFNVDVSALGVLHPLSLAVQMVLVHPFVDGNGRMARASFVLASRKYRGGREVLANIDRLWSNGCLLIHAICNSVIDNGWSELDFTELLKTL